jgi:hypothetical protein
MRQERVQTEDNALSEALRNREQSQQWWTQQEEFWNQQLEEAQQKLEDSPRHSSSQEDLP